MYLFVDWPTVFVEAFFKLPFRLSNVLFIASSAFYHVYKVTQFLFFLFFLFLA